MFRIPTDVSLYRVSSQELAEAMLKAMTHPRAPRPAHTTRNKLVQSEQQESARVRAHLDGQDISHSPLWLAPGIPSYYGSLLLADSLGIERDKEEVTVGRRQGKPVYYATVYCSMDRTVRVGAATSRHPDVAVELAFRNAIRHLHHGHRRSS